MFRSFSVNIIAGLSSIPCSFAVHTIHVSNAVMWMQPLQKYSMVSLGFSMEHQGLSIGHHRFSMAHHGCDPVHHGTPWGFHRAPWYFHGSAWDVDGTGHHGLSIAMLYPCWPMSMQIHTCLLQRCTYSFNI